MAFDIRPPATNSSNKSSSRSSSSATAKGSNIEPFAAQLAAKLPKQPPAPKQPAPSKPSSASKAAQPKPSQSPHSDDSSQKPVSAHPADRPKADPARDHTPTQGSANKDPASDDSPADNGAPGENTANGNGKDVGKGRGASRGATDKAARTSQSDAAAESDAAASQLEALAKAPAAETTGLSLLQLLAQASQGDDSDPASGVTDDPKATTDDDKTTADTDPNALVLAMLSQLFAGAASHAVATPSGTAATAGSSGTDSSGTVDGIAAGGVDTARSSNGATADQALLSLLEQKLGADASDKADTQSSEATASASATSSPDNKGAADGTTVRPEAVAQSLAQMGAASHFARNTHTAALQSNVGTPAWKEELGGQLTYMTHRGLESGSLRVSPEHLGPVEVQITVQNGDASVWFGASHPDTRAALEQALPQLREMFAQQGLTLADSGVSREPPRNQSRSRAPQSIAAVSATAGTDTSTAVATRVSLGLVDTYA